MPEDKNKASAKYGAAQITVLEGLDPVRKRPGMYIGGTGVDGLHHLIWEITDNAIDEGMAGYCTEINVRLLPDNIISVQDNGRGIPVEKHAKTKKSTLETVLTVLHAGGKFGGEGYKVSGGLHGVGASVVNALSEWLEAEVHRDGGVFKHSYKRGVPQGQVKKVGTAKDTGTTITFKADKEIFKEIDYNWDRILQRFRQQAYLTPGIRIAVSDEREAGKIKQYTFLFEGGIKAYVHQMNLGKDIKNDTIFYAKQEFDNSFMVEVAMQYTDSFNESILTFANNIHTVEGGTHLTGFRTALTRTINDYARKQGFLKEKEENLTADDVKEGLTAVLSVRLREPQFEGQTKGKLGTPEMRTYVQQVMNEAFTAYLEENPRDARAIIEKVALAAKARMAARAARDTVLRKGALDGFALPGKLADCSNKDPGQSEIFVVEGDSAGGCFAPETTIQLVSGTQKTIKELAEDWEKNITHFGYAANEKGDIRIIPLEHPRLTKKDALLVEVKLDNGQKIRCTPDHKFRLRDGSYIEAQHLHMGQSLMPLKQRFTAKGENPGEGYEMVWMNDRQKWWHTHHLADLYNLLTSKYTKKQGIVRHHVDFDKKNNDPRNIQRMDKQEHLNLHAKLASDLLKRLWKDPEYRRRKIKQASISAKKQWLDPAYHAYMSQQGKKQRQNPAMTKAVLEGFQTWFKQLNAQEYADYCQRSQDLFSAYWASPEHRAKQSSRTSKYFTTHPEAKQFLSEIAKVQWKNEELLKWRSEETKKQWEVEGFREQHVEAVKNWWEDHPEHAEKIRAAREKTWADPKKRANIKNGLAQWRQSTTTEEKANKIREGIKLKSLALLNKVIAKKDYQSAYNELRKNEAPTCFRLESLLRNYYQNNEAALLEAAKNVNCKVASVRMLQEKSDVYDITVGHYHNFALGAGVFVHNSAKQGRDRTFQAILPLRGKILNVERARLDKMLANNEVKALIIAMGTGIGEEFDVSKLRYHRIVIATDADVDGSHIRTLLLTLFFRHFQPLLDGGYIYIAQPPLYKVSKGKEIQYVYDDAAKDALVKKLGGSGSEVVEDTEGAEVKKTGGISIQRYKGLGEMNPGELWETTMDPANRVLKQVKIEDAEEADRMFDILMGNEVGPRKKWIQTHAKTVENLDI